MPRNNFPHRLQRLMVLALREGWRVEFNANRQLTLRKPGYAPIHTGTRANDIRRAIQHQQSKDEPNDD